MSEVTRDPGALRRFAPVVIIGLAALSGPILLLATSTHGIHITFDSYTYLGAANNLAHGKGLTYPFGQPGAPVTLFPPLFPALLSGGYLFGVNELSWALWQSAVLFGLLEIVAGLGVYWSTNRSLPTALAGMALVLLGVPTLLAYSSVLSESIFYPAELAALFFLGAHLRTDRTRDLILAGVATSIAMLARYAGLSLLLSGCLLLVVWPKRRIIDRVRVLATYAVISLAVSIGWTVRNLVSSSTITGGDHYSLHALTRAQIGDGLRVVYGWFSTERFPGPAGLDIFVLIGVGTILGTLIWAALGGSHRPDLTFPPASVALLVFPVVHLAFLVVVDVFSTRTPPLNVRILGPMYLALALGLLILGWAVWQGSGARIIPTRIALLLGLGALLAIVGMGAHTYIQQRVSVRTKTADPLVALSGLLRPAMRADPATIIYGNDASATWFATGRAVWDLPPTCTGLDRIPSPTYHDDLAALGKRLKDKPRMVVVITGEGNLRFTALEPPACRYSLSELAAALEVKPHTLPSGVVILTPDGPSRPG